MYIKTDKKTLDDLYEYYDDRKYIHPDPLEFLYNYNKPEDIEVAGLIAASLAYGQVNQILKSVGRVLEAIGKSPSNFLKNTDSKRFFAIFGDFKHRFTTGEEIAVFLKNIGIVLRKYGSLNECFLHGYIKEQEILPALLSFLREIRFGDCSSYNSLAPMPNGKCAYKRINLYLRWMVRKDNIDLGVWSGISTAKLIIPLDIHMHRVAKNLGLTCRKQADIKTALEITESLKKLDPLDPVKYDFALTRPGIRTKNKDRKRCSL